MSKEMTDLIKWYSENGVEGLLRIMNENEELKQVVIELEGKLKDWENKYSIPKTVSISIPMTRKGTWR